MPSAILSIRIIADATKAVKELDKSGKAAGKWSGGITKAAAVAGVGLAALGGYALAGVKGAAEDAKAQVILADTLKKSAGATDEAIASTEDWISKTSLAAGVADDELRPALGDLVRATGDVGTAQQAMQSALDISAATGQDVGTVSKALAKAYKGQTKGLGKLGLGLDAATLKAGNMGEIMGQISNKVGGASAKAADTAAGKYDRLQVALGETQETLGAALLPALTKVLSILQPMLATLSQNTPLVLGLVAGFAALAAILVTAAVAMRVQALATMLSTEGTIANTVAQKIAAIATKAWAAATWLLNAAFTPLGAVVLVVIALALAIVIAYKRSATFRAIVQGALHAVLTAVQTVWKWIKSNWPLLLVILTGPFGIVVLLVIKHFDRIKQVVKTAISTITRVWSAITHALSGPIQTAKGIIITALNLIKSTARIVFDAFKTAMQPVVSIFETLWGWIDKVIGLLGKIKIPKLPKWLDPTAKAAPTVAMAPSVAGLGRTSAARTVPVAAGGISITVNGAIDPQQTARAVQRMLHTADVRSGRRRFA